MCIKIFLIICSLLSIFVDSTVIDQRQSGELNVQVDLKHLQIIALLKGGKEEYVDYDYAYDYSEMTIKPQNRTTPKPLIVTSTTDKPSTVENNATTLFLETTTVLTATSDGMEPALHETINHDIASRNSTVPYNNVTELTAHKENTTAMNTSIQTFNSTSAPTTCRKGFVLNSKGDCEIKLQGAGNALLKLVKLSQKLKLRRENSSGNAESD